MQVLVPWVGLEIFRGQWNIVHGGLRGDGRRVITPLLPEEREKRNDRSILMAEFRMLAKKTIFRLLDVLVGQVDFFNGICLLSGSESDGGDSATCFFDMIKSFPGDRDLVRLNMYWKPLVCTIWQNHRLMNEQPGASIHRGCAHDWFCVRDQGTF